MTGPFFSDTTGHVWCLQLRTVLIALAEMSRQRFALRAETTRRDTAALS